MQLTASCRIRARRMAWTKTLLIMKMIAVLLAGAFLQVSASGTAQKVNLSEKNAPLQKIFKQIHRQTGFQFFYEDALLDKAGKVNIQVQNASVEDALTACFHNLPLRFEVVDQTIVVSAKTMTPADLKPETDLPPPITVRGAVRNDKGELLAGVSVTIKGTTRGTVTNENGFFVLEGVEENAILIFSGVDLEQQEVAVRGRTSLLVQLVVKVSPLDDVQVIGYGKTTRRLKTGAVSTLKGTDIENQPVTNVGQALQGRIAGVSMNQNGGALGAGMEIQVRGVNTIESGNQPLIIVDGAVMPDANRGLGSGVGSYMAWSGSTPLNNINPADIESVEVLKDADATAIYGSRGANGVILITTKKGRIGATRFNVDVSTWNNSATYLPPRLNLSQYLTMRRQAFAMGNHNPATGVALNPITTTANNAPDLLVWDTTKATADWQQFEFGNAAPSVNSQVTLSGGEKRLNFYTSAGYMKQRDITRGAATLERFSATMGVNHTSANNKLQVNLNANYVSNVLSPSRTPSAGLISGLPPNMPMTNPDGSPYWPAPSITQSALLTNPLAGDEAEARNRSSSLMANLDFSYQLAKGLSFKTLFGFNKQDNNTVTITPSTFINPLNPGSSVPQHSTNNSTFQTLNFEPQLAYTTKISKGKLDLLAGSTFFDRKTSSYSLAFQGYTTDLLLESWRGGSTVADYRNASGVYRFNSVFGRAGYNWDNKYLLNLTYRRDGSSRFGSNRQWGDFGAVGMGWIFTKEKWLEDKIPGLTYGKLRASYGTSGNDNIADYRWTSLYGPSFYDGRAALVASFLADPSVGWESTRKLDAALELGFFNDRVLLNVNWYRSRTTDLLLSTPVPAQTGFSTFITNTPAVVENKGWEFELTTRNLDAKSKLQWTTSFNLSTVENQLVEFPGLANSSFANRLKIGLPINSPRMPLNAEWSQIYLGVDTATGLPRFQDLDGNGIINNNDRTFIGSAIPRLFGGLGNKLTYKGFELDVFFQFSQQMATNWMFLNTYPGQLYNPPAADWYGNYWTKPGDNTKYPRLFTGVTNATTALMQNIFPTSSATLQDVFYVRLKTLSLSYSLPTEWVSKARMSRASVYLRGQNLFTWTSEKLFKDPELTTLRSGQILRTWTAGVQLSF